MGFILVVLFALGLPTNPFGQIVNRVKLPHLCIVTPPGSLLPLKLQLKQQSPVQKHSKEEEQHSEHCQTAESSGHGLLVALWVRTWREWSLARRWG